MPLSDFILRELVQEDGASLATESTEDAFLFCASLATSHYENFPVGSVVIDAKRRQYFYAIYAFARLADDVADHYRASTQEKLAILTLFSDLLERDVTDLRHPVFVALSRTRIDCNIETEPFKRLLNAFEMDSDFRQVETWNDTLNYCHYSANPVGELILKLFGEDLQNCLWASDKICTALQLINFWQDLSIDVAQGRQYIPRSLFSQYGLQEGSLVAQQFSSKFPSQSALSFKNLLEELYDRTDRLLSDGLVLPHMVVSRRLRLELCLVCEGGARMLQKVRQLDLDILHRRPTLNTWDSLGIIAKGLVRFLGLHH